MAEDAGFCWMCLLAASQPHEAHVEERSHLQAGPFEGGFLPDAFILFFSPF